MGLFSFLDPAADFIFGPLLGLPPFWSILAIAILISVIVTVVYKLVTPQQLMRQLKDEMKTLQKEMKELRNDPQKAMHVQQQVMAANAKYMRHSLKPTFITLIPVILIFGWLQGHLAFEPLAPGEEFTVTVIPQKGYTGNVSVEVPEGLELTAPGEKDVRNGHVLFTFRGQREGDYTLLFSADSFQAPKDVKITTERDYAPVEQRYKGTITAVRTTHKPVTVMNLLGWKIGWLGSYIIFSILLTTLLRRLLKVA
jgi:uncharacterized membrane protein (DUF106 family)